jgi:hypothetical protein
LAGLDFSHGHRQCGKFAEAFGRLAAPAFVTIDATPFELNTICFSLPKAAT